MNNSNNGTEEKQQYNKACIPCSTARVKCVRYVSSPSVPCHRCVQTGRECVPRLQKPLGRPPQKKRKQHEKCQLRNLLCHTPPPQYILLQQPESSSAPSSQVKQQHRQILPRPPPRQED